MVKAHKTALHPRIKINDIPKIRPIRVAARRQNELMTIIASGEMEDVEWLDEDQVDTTGVTMPHQQQRFRRFKLLPTSPSPPSWISHWSEPVTEGVTDDRFTSLKLTEFRV